MTVEEREKSIYEVGETLLAEQLSKNIIAIATTLQNAPEACCGNFLEAMQDLLKQAAKAQKQGNQGPLQYICISYLQSSLYTGSYLLRIDAYDERQFGDLTDTYVYWSPDFIFQHLASDIAHFRKHIGESVLRAQEPEIMCFVRQYSLHYYRIVQQFLTDFIIPIVQAAGVAAEEDFVITFGGYMDEAIAIVDGEEFDHEIFPH